MAFGFGFNKQKALSAAEKYVQQGKLQNAIAEYEKILKNDAKDLTVTNTVGDLYARLGDVDKATDCFKNVGDAYATQGFTVKAIAIFKKISKLKPSLENVLRLAELYTQQGLFNDARAQYLQVAEQFLKANEFENAVRIFQKILEMDPENVAMRVRLAEVYVRLGKKTEAWQIFSAAAESMRSRGSLSGADEVLQRMLALDPTNGYALLMQAKNLLDSGDAEASIECLQKIADLDSNPEALRDLLRACLQMGRLSEASTLANKLLSVHNDLSSISSFADALMQAGQYENALQVYDQHADRLLAENSERVLENLHSIIGHVRDNPASLEKLLALFQKAGETTHVTEVSELLAHASVQSGDLPRARDLYQKLATLEPQNPLHMKSYQQVVGQLGGSATSNAITAEEAAVMVDELEATSPSVHQHYPDDVAIAVRSALTDAELFISYNMPAKAFEPLIAACAQAPHDLRLNQRLAALHTRASRFAEASVCCRNLQSVYSEAGYPDEAKRYSELARRYEERSSVLAAPAEQVIAQTTSEERSVPSSNVPWPSTVAPMAEISFGSEGEEFSVVDETPNSTEISAEAPEEIDLSDWEDSISVEGDVPAEAVEADVAGAVGDHALPGAAAIEIIDEMRFYLSHGMPDQARAALPRLQALTQDEGVVAQLRAEIETAVNAVSAAVTTKGKEKAKNEKAIVKKPEPVEAPAIPEFAVEEVAAEEIPAAQTPAVIEEPAPIAELAVVAEEAPQAAADVQEETAPVEAFPSEAFPVEDLPVEEVPFEDLPVAEAPVTLEAASAITAELHAEEHVPVAPFQAFVADLEESLGSAETAPVEASIQAPAAAEIPAEITARASIAHELEPVQAAEQASEQAAHHVEVAQSEVAQPAPIFGEFVADLEASLGEDFLAAAPMPPESLPALAATPVVAEALPAQPVAAISAPMAAGAAASASSTNNQPSAQTASAPVASAVPHIPIPMPPPIAVVVPISPLAGPATISTSTSIKSSPFSEETGVDLNEMFGELKQDLESGISPSEEDPETHYNLGVAFREMGLLDEAIGELQKACQSVDRGHVFPQTMQAYTWLAQCFLEKGVPEAAVGWYDKALRVPGIDGETRVALHYELGSAFESAGDKPAALKNFLAVYGSNIDYRDVAERIKALKS